MITQQNTIRSKIVCRLQRYLNYGTKLGIGCNPSPDSIKLAQRYTTSIYPFDFFSDCSLWGVYEITSIVCEKSE